MKSENPFETVEEFFNENKYSPSWEVEQKLTICAYRNYLMTEGDFDEFNANDSVISGIVNGYLSVYPYPDLVKYNFTENDESIVFRKEINGEYWYVVDSRI